MLFNKNRPNDGKLGPEEIKNLLQKFKTDYDDLKKDFNSKAFDYDEFYSRYLNALKTKYPIESFFLLEIKLLEDIKSKFTKKREDKEKAKAYSQKIDTIINHNFSKINDYPAVQLYPNMHPELEKLIGGLRHFLYNYWLALSKEIKNTQDIVLINDYSERTQTLSYKVGVEKDGSSVGLSELASQVSSALKKKIGKSKEYVEMAYMKQYAYLANDLLKACQAYKAYLDTKDLQRTSDYLSKLIADFRIGGFA